MPYVAPTLMERPGTLLAIVLLLTSLASSGVIACWVARSRSHWFTRTAVFVGLLSAFLLIPAYEPIVAIAVQCVVVVICIQVVRWWQGRDEAERARRRPVFSISSILLATVVCATVIMIGFNLPSLGTDAWLNVVAIGLASGFATLLGLWLFVGRRPWWWLRLPTVCLACFGLAWIAECIDFTFEIFNPDVAMSWPLIVSAEWFRSDMLDFRERWIAWTAILLGIACFPFVTNLLWTWAFGSAEPRSKLRGIAIGGLLFAWCLLFISPPLFVYVRLVTRTAIPSDNLPEANGWDDLAVAGRFADDRWMAFSNSEVQAVYGRSFEYLFDGESTATLAGLKKIVERIAPIYERIDLALEREIQCPLDYTSHDVGIDDLNRMGILVQAIDCRARVEESEGRYREAAASYLQALRLAYRLRHHSLPFHASTGIECAVLGRRRLFQCRQNLTKEDCLELASALHEIELAAESAQAFIDRDRIWEQHRDGWTGHLKLILFELSVPEGDRGFANFRIRLRRELAEMRLLRTELAIHAWRLDHGRLPDSLNELVPEYLVRIPDDPFSIGAKPLRYRMVDESELDEINPFYAPVDDDPTSLLFGLTSGPLESGESEDFPSIPIDSFAQTFLPEESDLQTPPTSVSESFLANPEQGSSLLQERNRSSSESDEYADSYRLYVVNEQGVDLRNTPYDYFNHDVKTLTLDILFRLEESGFR
ncbi:MAG: DMT family transporter [Planctomycetota bacterium]